MVYFKLLGVGGWYGSLSGCFSVRVVLLWCFYRKFRYWVLEIFSVQICYYFSKIDELS